jgi:hypothetical protein
MTACGQSNPLAEEESARIAAVTAGGQPPGYVLCSIDVPGAESGSIRALSINDRGQVIGTYVTTSPIWGLASAGFVE